MIFLLLYYIILNYIKIYYENIFCKFNLNRIKIINNSIYNYNDVDVNNNM